MNNSLNVLNRNGSSAGLVGLLLASGLLLSVAAYGETMEEKLKVQAEQEKKELAAAEEKRQAEKDAKAAAAKAAKKEKERKAAAAAKKKAQEEADRKAAARAQAKREAAAAKEAEAKRLAEEQAKLDPPPVIVVEPPAARSAATAIEPDMQLIPAGTFMMGCVDGRDNVQGSCSDDEKPAHEVSINAFHMGKYEVTFDQWDACEKAKACPHADDEGWGRGNRPVINVSWNDITQQYIPWLNQQTGKHYRLPTEAEWEYAARGGSDTAYPWGNTISCSNANYGYFLNQCKTDRTKPVGSYSANGYGLYDTLGNVWEWCEDWYGSDYYKSSPASAPQGSDAGASRVLRGGSWNRIAQIVRSAYRDSYTPDYRTPYFGFRLARS